MGNFTCLAASQNQALKHCDASKQETPALSAPPAISIIIPVYNVESCLRKCLDSAIRQTFSNTEIICVNDGSSDGSLGILKEYANRDRRVIIVDKFNGGLSSARNAGLNIARGKYILFLDSDDYIDVELCARTFEGAEALSADVIFFNALPFTKQGLSTQCFFKYPAVSGVFRPRDIPLFLTQVSAWNRLYRRELIQDVRFVEGIYFEDQPFSAEVNILAQRAGLIDHPLYYYRRDNPFAITGDYQASMGIFASFDALKQVLCKYGVEQELYGSVYAASEVVNYKNRILILPVRYWREFYSTARRRLRGVDWPLLMAGCHEYHRRFWPWSRSEQYIVACLRWCGFWLYLPRAIVADCRNIKYAFYSMPFVGRILEWFSAFMSLGRYPDEI